VIAEAHRLARSRETSVSSMFSRFVRLLSQRDREGQRGRIGRLTRSATGVIRLPEGLSERDVLEDALAEEHGL